MHGKKSDIYRNYWNKTNLHQYLLCTDDTIIRDMVSKWNIQGDQFLG